MSDFESDSDFSVLSIMSSDDSDEDDMQLMEPRVRNEDYLEVIVPRYSDEEFFKHTSYSPSYNFLMRKSVSRILFRITSFLSNLSPRFIKWPSEEEKRISAEHFNEAGFQNVIGAMDGCHIKIDKPSNDSESYINLKGFYAIQLQAVCDHNTKIIDLLVGYPGSVHDSRVFRNSRLGNNSEQRCGRYFLLADSGYPLKRNLLTPYRDRGNLTRRQINYNIKLSKTRCLIEHCFVILKQKFRQLYHIKLRSIPFLVHLIRAACVLHNIAIEDNFNFEEVVRDNEDIQQYNLDDSDDDEELNAVNVRNNICNNLPM